MIDLNHTDLSIKDKDPLEKLRGGNCPHENSGVTADRVYTRLRDAILNAELRPNKRLVENELSLWLNVSRTPIREALVCLEKDGLVERKNGWTVREHTPFEIQAQLECRMMIEGYAARLAAGRRSEADLRELRTFADAMEKTVISGMEYYQINDHFHQLIVDTASNPTLQHIYYQTKLNYWSLGVPIIYETELNNKMLAHHQAIISALATGNGDLAEEISRDHVKLNMEFILNAFEGKG